MKITIKKSTACGPTSFFEKELTELCPVKKEREYLQRLFGAALLRCNLPQNLK